MGAIAFAVANMGRSELYCENCNTIFPLYRHKNRLRGNGHIKHVWCYKCREYTAHVEVQST